MSVVIEYRLNKASAAEIAAHLACCDADFVPPLSCRIKIKGYANKITSKATRFEAWSDGTLVGLVAAYCNDQDKGISYITSVSVLKEWVGKGIATRLLSQCVDHAKVLRMRRISLEVASDNAPAIELYEKIGFIVDQSNAPLVIMNLNLEGQEKHE